MVAILAAHIGLCAASRGNLRADTQAPRAHDFVELSDAQDLMFGRCAASLRSPKLIDLNYYKEKKW